MKFKYSAFTENTPEMREWLESIGINGIINNTLGNIILVVNGQYMCFELEGNLGSNFSDAVDCRNNPALFQAVTAMRDDTDNQQFFIHKNGEFILCWQNELKNVLDNDERYQDYCVYDCHKATLEELIAHFKINK